MKFIKCIKSRNSNRSRLGALDEGTCWGC